MMGPKQEAQAVLFYEFSFEDCLAQTHISFLHALTRARHQIIILELLNPLVQGQNANAQI